MKKLLLIAMGVIVAGCLTNCGNETDKNIENYMKSGKAIDKEAQYFMPKLENLKGAKDIKYMHTDGSNLIAETDSMALVTNYGEADYKKEKEKINENFEFLDENIVNENGDYVIQDNEFDINSYKFRVVESNKKWMSDFPKSFGIIGTSDKDKNIAYLYFCDLDLDYMTEKDKNESMEKFIKDNFEYDF